MPDERPTPPPLKWSHSVPLWILATIGVVLFLRAASQLLIPIVLAALISYALEPVVAALARHHVPRLAGTSLMLLTLLGLGGWGAYSLRDDMLQAFDSLPDAARRARDMLSSPSGSGPLASVQETLDILRGVDGGRSADAPPHTAGDDAVPLGGRNGASISGARTLIQRGVGSLFAVAGNLVVIFFLVFFLLTAGHHFRDRLVEIAGKRRDLTDEVIDQINEQIQRFLLVRLVTAVAVGALTWLVLAWLGVPNAVVWGLFAGTFNSIPYFGPIIVSAGLFLVGVVQGGGATQALQMAGAALVITSIEGWLLTPPLMGKAERMSAVTVFLGLLLWTWIWGAWGTILAVPMLVIVKSVADHLESLKPLRRLMAP